ncbi:MAG: peptidoglycan editing factor PgeF [Acidobacteriota bacterium]|nr:peptidoglycan editing factor PgeF [Acidobacteriota bacterium]
MKENLRNEPNWLVPEGGPEWVRWGFGMRGAVLRNELASAHQVHGARVVVVDRPGPAGDADALVTNTPGLMLGIKTADCLPLLLIDTRRRAVAAVHAGWRGTAQGIAGAAIRAMQEKCETNPIDVVAALGPAIGRCCFEVGPEVAREFTGFDRELANAAEKCHLDLRAINEWQLKEVGVEMILRNELCTVCEPEKFESFRREREKAGRMWSVIEVIEG